MTIGETIKRLRRENDVTQEKLAAYLKISSQSISKWENNNAMPDISLLVPLANFFHISLDDLFDRNAACEASEVDAYLAEGNRLHQTAHYEEALALWREAAAKYPRNFQCMGQLASALWCQTVRNVPVEEKEACAKEAIWLCERILEDCTDSSIRAGALQTLVFVYSNRQLTCAEEEKAVKYAEMAGSCYVCREILLEKAYFTENSGQKAREMRQRNLLTFLDFVSGRIVHEMYESAEERIFALNSALKLWETVIPDGNYLFYHTRVGEIHDLLARCHAAKRERERTLEHLRLALGHAAAYDGIPCGAHSFTSPLISAAGVTQGESFSVTESVKRDILREDCFAFLRDDPAFLAIMES